jgi:hypothetical protein
LSVRKSCSIADDSTCDTLLDKLEPSQRNLLSSQQLVASNRRRSLGLVFEGKESA